MSSSTTLTAGIQSATATAVATTAVKDLDSLYSYIPSESGNFAFAVLFAIAMAAHVGLAMWYKQRWTGVTFFFGLGFEVIGYAARTLAHDNPTKDGEYLTQITCLTIAPCFIMASYYYLLGKLVMIYGPQFSMIPPIYYSYIFIISDIISLVLQAAGAASAAEALVNHKDTQLGTNIMVGGLAFQVASMTVFIFFWGYFFYNVYFKSSEQGNHSNHQLTIWNFSNTDYKDEIFNPQFAHVRKHKLFKWFPFAVSFGTIAIYTRCIYRVIELAEGWGGFLITHEIYVFVLDGFMILLASYILLPPFYPGFIFGRNTKIVVPKSLKFSVPREGINMSRPVEDKVSLIRSDNGESF
ncbi:hypothetical protein DASC09_031150 [Saccharomycopsis crataegensis]|uniref:Sphingoid long-chain base transporter RSB1 n=1 Tax=Saccharomycopsis crataegensis TaxID=43959 RepID=A0AAV5QMM5_9ASCO|nr:hypothetical protein DASC09_031150 [Saccharomycopsis crataegensis]